MFQKTLAQKWFAFVLATMPALIGVLALAPCVVLQAATPVTTITATSPVTAGATARSASVPSQSGATYLWTITGGTITAGSTTRTATYTAGTGASLTLSCKVTISGTAATGTKTVTIVPAPVTTITAASPVTISKTGLSASVPAQSGATYAWTITGGTITAGASTNAATYSAGTGTSLTLSCKVTNSAGTAATGTKTVTVVAAPNTTITAATSVTTGATGLIASVPAQTGATYAWSITGGTLTAGATTTTATYTAGTGTSITLSCQVTNSAGTSATGNKTVTIVAAPITTITAPGTVSPSATGLMASVPSQTGATYAWTISGGTITAGAATTTATFTAGTGTSLTLTCKVTNSAGTAATGNKTVTIAVVPNATITASATVTAGATGLTASVPVQSGATYVWTITGGAITVGSGTNAITYTAGTAGTATLGCTVTIAGNAVPGTKTVTVVPTPIATITASLVVNASQSGLIATVPAQSGVTYLWTVTGGTITSGSTTNSLTYKAGTSKSLTLSCKVTNAAGTFVTGTQVVQVGTLVLSPASTIADFWSGIAFTASQSGVQQFDINWSVLNPAGGTIDAGGNYTSGNQAGVFTVRAAQMADDTIFGLATVTVEDGSNVNLTMTPFAATLSPGATQVYTVVVSGTSNPAVTFNTTGGSVSSSRSGNTTTVTYRAPTTPGSYRITAASVPFPYRTSDGRAFVQASGAPVVQSMMSSSYEILEGESVDLAWVIQGAESLALETIDTYGNATVIDPAPSVSGTHLKVTIDRNWGKDRLDPDGTGYKRYRIHATNVNGSSAFEVSIKVHCPMITKFNQDKWTIAPGEKVHLDYAFTNGSGSISPGIGAVTSGQSIDVWPTASTIYTLSVTNAQGGVVQQTAQVTVNAIDGQWSTPPNFPFTWTGLATRLWDNRIAFMGTDNSIWFLDPTMGTWASLGFNGAYAHTYGTMTSLPDGRLLLIGGRNGNSGSLVRTSIIDTTRNLYIDEWSNPSLQRYGHSATLLMDGKILIAGGTIRDQYGYPTPTSSVVLLDPVTGQSEDIGSPSVYSPDWPKGVLLPSGDVLLFRGQVLYRATTRVLESLPNGAGGEPESFLTDGTLLLGSYLNTYNGTGVSPGGKFDPATMTYTSLPEFGNFGNRAVALSDGGAIAFSYPYSNVPMVASRMLPNWAGPQNLPAPPSSLPIDTFAPGLLGEDGKVLLTATLAFDPQSPFQIRPATAMAMAGGSIAFRTTGALSAGGATWTCDGGVIAADGTWKAPAGAGHYRITATSPSDSSKTSTAWIRVSGIGKIIPQGVGIAKGETQQLTAVVQGAGDQRVTWAILGNTLGCTLTPGGLFTAGGVGGQVQVVATSVLDPTYSGQGKVTIQPSGLPRNLQISLDKPGPLAIGESFSITFQAEDAFQYHLGLMNAVGSGIEVFGEDVFQSGNATRTWTLTSDVFKGQTTGGSYNRWISTAQGGYFDRSPLELYLYATNQYGQVKTSIPLVFVDPRAFSVVPSHSGVNANQTLNMVLAPQGMGGIVPSVSWSTSSGTVSAEGVLTAPSTGGQITLTATATSEPALTARALVDVVAGLPTVTNFRATSTSIVKGQSTTLQWNVLGATNLDLMLQNGELIPATAGGLDGSLTISPQESTSYTLIATNAFGQTTSNSIQIVVNPPTVSLLPASVHSFPGAITTFTATSDLPVAWDVQEKTTPFQYASNFTGRNGNSVTFVSPAQAGTYHIIAYVPGVPGLQAVATLTVDGSGAGSTLPAVDVFTSDAKVFGPGQQVTLSWSVRGATSLVLSQPSMGWSQDVTTLGQYKVSPATTTSYTLTATNAAGGVNQVLDLTAWTNRVELTINPTNVTMGPGGQGIFGFNLKAPTNRIVWAATGGTITEAGQFTAPRTAGNYVVTATSVDDPTVVAAANVVVRPSSLVIQPAQVNLSVGQSYGFGFTYEWAVSSALTWTATGGTITSDGSYTAPSQPGTYLVTVASVAEPSLNATSTVVVSPIRLEIRPGSVSLFPGWKQGFKYYASLGTGTWSVVEANGGSIASDGTYTAPVLAGRYHVRLTSDLDPTVKTEVLVLVGSSTGAGGSGTGSSTGTSGTKLTVTPLVAVVDAGSHTYFSATVEGNDDTSVNWSIKQPAPDAVVDEAGTFVSNRQGVYTVLASSAADPSAQVELTVIVNGAIHALEGGPNGILGYSVTALQDGRVLIAGGCKERGPYDMSVWAGDFESAAWIYDPTTGETHRTAGNLLHARTDHQALLLKDGRVLIAGGLSRWNGDANHVPQGTGPNGRLDVATNFPFAEIFDPISETFLELPSQKHPIYWATAGPGLMYDNHIGALRESIGGPSFAFTLPDGRGYIEGGLPDIPLSPKNSSDYFDPVTSTFDMVRNSAEYNWFHIHRAFEAAAMRPDGMCLITGGVVSAGLTSEKLVVRNSGRYKNLLTGEIKGNWWETLPQGRAGHTITALADGRFLIVGGWTRGVADGTQTKGNFGTWLLTDVTGSAEIFDPTTMSFTPVASALSQPRTLHAALLLPTGKVLIAGGKYWDGDKYLFPNKLEVFDPDTNSFSVMDNLPYGLDEPKLAIQRDGGVFISGLRVEPMEGFDSKAATDNQGMRPLSLLAEVPGGATLFGTIPPVWTFDAAPEEAALKKGDIAGDEYDIPLVAMTTTDWPNIGIRPARARISVPLPGEVNAKHRYFVLKVRKPSPAYVIKGVQVTVAAGDQRQTVLGRYGFQPLVAGVFERLYTRFDVSYLEPGGTGDAAYERVTETTRKEWLLSWLPDKAPMDGVTEYYKVRVTMDEANPSTIQYGYGNGESLLPPSDTLRYEFTLNYQIGAEGPGMREGLAILYNHKAVIEAEWDAKQYFLNKSYSTANNDKWCRQDLFSWLSNDTRRAMLEPMNDFTLEHGRNTGHVSAHLDGRQGDMYHPAYNAFISTVNGTSGATFRDQYLISVYQRASGWVENDATGKVTKTVPSDPEAVKALARWIRDARTRIQAIMEIDPVGKFGAMNFIYLSTATSSSSPISVTCKVLRDLMITGESTGLKVTYDDNTNIQYLPLNLTNHSALLAAERVLDWGIETKQWVADNTLTHTHHLHWQWGSKAVPFIKPKEN